MFHGRRDILDKLHAYFSQDIGRRHVSLLHGLGGAGKTQICLKFLDETDKSRYDASHSPIYVHH
jgi:tRNA A37 threonylcarbamoyladenosine biosynthesis protein TsaE